MPDQYNEHDFAVVMNMLRSDYGRMMSRWFPEGSDSRIMEMAVNYLNDDDAQHGDGKVWWYFN